MKRENGKYIVLGIGIGFLIAAALLLKFGGQEKASLSDREIIDRARELGMIFLTETIRLDSPDSQTGSEKTENRQSSLPENKEAQPDRQDGQNEEDDIITEVITEPDENIPNRLPPPDPNRPKPEKLYHQNNHF